MICDICKKKLASFHIKNNISGCDVCSDCYYKYGGTISSLLNYMSNAVPNEIKCSVCGTKLSLILDTLYVGCPNCYKELGNFIQPTIKKVQNAVNHEGKRPLNAEEITTSEYDRLKNELNRAITDENYEQAAIISERLKQLRES